MVDFSKYEPYFKKEEFDSRDLPGSGECMMPEFMDKLYKARIEAGCPFYITSGYRTLDHNKKVGDVDDSPHCQGVAADIACEDSRTRFKIVKALFDVGFVRIGVGHTFIHVDCDERDTKIQEVLWPYSDK